MRKEFQYDVFLSHNHKDKPRVRHIAERLKAAGLRVWYDDWCVNHGEIISLKVDEGLEQSRVLLQFVSPNALASNWLALERASAIHRDPTNESRIFVPVLLADCELPDTLRRYKHVDLREETDSAFAQLLSTCRINTANVPPPGNAVPKRVLSNLVVLDRTRLWIVAGLVLSVIGIAVAASAVLNSRTPVELQIAGGFKNAVKSVVKDWDARESLVVSGNLFAGLTDEASPNDPADRIPATYIRNHLEAGKKRGVVEIAEFEGIALNVNHSSESFDYRIPRGDYYWKISLPDDLKDSTRWIPKNCYVYGVEITDTSGQRNYLFPHFYWQQGPRNHLTLITYLRNQTSEVPLNPWQYNWKVRVYYGSRAPKVIGQ